MTKPGKKNKKKRSIPTEDNIEDSVPVEKRSKSELPDKSMSETNSFENMENDSQDKTKKDKSVETEVAENIEDNSTKKKRNKKKKKPESQASDVPESKMSNRQLKREKHAQRMAETDAASHKAIQTQALSYLSLWKYNKAEWKFNKVKQIWLHKHKFDTDKIPEELWQPFIEYFSAASGGIKKLLIDDCQKVIEQMEKSLEDKDPADKDKHSDFMYKRARDLLQNIHI